MFYLNFKNLEKFSWFGSYGNSCPNMLENIRLLILWNVIHEIRRRLLSLFAM